MPNSVRYLRTIIFGLMDSLVSTVGLLAGLSVAGVPRDTIALTGIVYAFVEGFSMAVGSYLSESSAEEYLTKKRARSSLALTEGVVMFLAFVLVACIPIIPYLFLPAWVALASSIGLSVIALFIAGAISGKLAKLSAFSRGLRMTLLGGAAIAVGVFVGSLFPAA